MILLCKPSKVKFALPASNFSGLAYSQVFFPPSNGLAPSNGNVAIVSSTVKVPRLPEPMEAFFNTEFLFSIPMSSTVNLLGRDTDLDRDITFLINQYN